MYYASNRTFAGEVADDAGAITAPGWYERNKGKIWSAVIIGVPALATVSLAARGRLVGATVAGVATAGSIGLANFVTTRFM